MKILLQTSTFGYLTYHSMCIRIKDIYPNTEFGILAPEGPKNAVNFLKNQDVIKYEIFDKFSHYKKTDYKKIKIFENSSNYKSIWRIIATSRKQGGAFGHGYVGYKYQGPYSYNNILQYFYNVLMNIEKIFDDFKPDIFLPALGISGIETSIIENICNQRKIPFTIFAGTRIKSFFAFASNTQLLFPQIDDTYKKNIQKYNRLNKSSKFRKAEILYKLLMQELHNPDYFDRVNSRFNIEKYDNSYSGTFLWIFNSFMKLFKGKNIFKYFFWIFNPKKTKILYFYLLYRIQQKKLTNINFYDQVNYKEKYIYYTLHCSPEYSINMQGTMWMNQINTIELIAKSIPSDWKVYVKEHPGTLVARLRPYNYYNDIKKIPNVKLIPIDADMHKIINNAQMVAVVVGTAGWEAIQRGIPSIAFAENTWDILKLSKRVSNYENLSIDIYQESKRVSKITKFERRKRLICYIAAVLEHSFEISFPEKIYYTEEGSYDQYFKSGKEIAEAFIKHLKYLKKNQRKSLVF